MVHTVRWAEEDDASLHIGQMQSVPAYLEILRSSDGKHRHPTRCIWREGKEHIRKIIKIK